MYRRYLGLFLISLLCLGCQTKDKALEFELRKSFKNYLNALENRKEYELRVVVNVPGLKEYKKHVNNLYLNYLDQLEQGLVSFDDQGIVLARFLKLSHYRYGILDFGKSEDGMTANMRISIHFSYDANLSHSGFEEGTKVYVPSQPWGSVIPLVIGKENPVPREQLKYIELDINFRRTNYEGVWQVMTMHPIKDSDQYETSFQANF